MARRIKGKVIARLPMEAVLALRSRGVQVAKNRKAYNRNADKAKLRKELSDV